MVFVGSTRTPRPVTVTTRIITLLIGNPYKPSFTTVTGWGVDPRYLRYFEVWENRCLMIIAIKIA